eukprot:TRINITY_DN18857_c0_g1_i1.p1 TRINITY_DN18857_c0_g1~~TRINITY_DN18857_c0_g1_i1.p1  ORF type:complete len:660 (+),score=63.15 TRINITY_DN18857_c0_g1_i1:65-2044(+)
MALLPVSSFDVEEQRPLLYQSEADQSTGWKIIQPDQPRTFRRFLWSKLCGCWCPNVIVFLPVATLLLFALGLVAGVLLFLVCALLYVLLGIPVCGLYAYFRSYSLAPWYWFSELYTRATFYTYQHVLLARKRRPDCSPEFMPAAKMRHEEILKKYTLEYALNVKVPKGCEEEFTSEPISADSLSQWLEENLSKLPMTDSFVEFEPDEDPVAYMMNQLGSVYPKIYQVWDDKLSDVALTRFCLYGLGAHRVETEFIDGSKFYVVRANALSSLPVRDGFARYGGDAYFDASWNPVKIVDLGVGPRLEDGTVKAVTTRPSDPGWDHAKFRFRSSLSVLVTFADHLYGIHLQTSNLMVTALREKLPADHPVRRFLTPFTYQTISVNDNARNNLCQPRSMGQRCFAFTDRGMHLAFAAAPSLLKGGLEVPAAEGGPMFNRVEYADYLKEKRGIDTEYHRQCRAYYTICNEFVMDYLDCYYATKTDVVKDPELRAMVVQFMHQLEYCTPGQMMVNLSSSDITLDTDGLYKKIVDTLTNFLFIATAAHEQAGAVEAYVQDVSFCAFKWTPGKSIGTKQTATAQGLLMSFTSTPMPMLLGADWTHLFTPPTVKGKSAIAALTKFQDALAVMARRCDAYNEQSSQRPFPECFPLYTINPRLLETSISV